LTRIVVKAILELAAIKCSEQDIELTLQMIIDAKSAIRQQIKVAKWGGEAELGGVGFVFKCIRTRSILNTA
jgi:hypothetical protein